MFDIGFSELLLIAVVALVVMGPQRLPQAMRTLALWWGRARQMFGNLRRELENEVGMDDIRRQLHNEEILREIKKSTEEFERTEAALSSEMSVTEDDGTSEPPTTDTQTPPQDQK
ncbi:MAG: twin-arginine translocase subunit TatB [Gammaproteobacteria bacterium]|nr:MAG: twin-arginine translocase subunit TatB [Gammaproteobacteria bacterium]